ncbi:hypothetical protein QQ045_031293 [Rhodiola kirilowii]
MFTLASQRKKRNSIDKIKAANGIWISNDTEICKNAMMYYEKLFQKNIQEEVPNWREALAVIDKKLGPTKAPGLDGFSAIFFQKSWDLVKRDVTDFALKFLNEGTIDPGVNETLMGLITLVLKVIFFIRADMDDIFRFKSILKRYEELLGQLVNYNKSELCMGNNVDIHKAGALSSILGVKIVHKIEKYLGLPICFSNRKIELFSFVENRIWKKLNGWKEKLLSAAVTVTEWEFTNMANWLWYCVNGIWFTRNSLWHNGEFYNISDVVMKVKAQIKDILRPGFKFVVSRCESAVQWQPPEVDFLKINCDGAWDQVTGAGGLGFICRDNMGRAQFAAACKKERFRDIIEAECAAIYLAMQEAEKIPRHSLTVDSKMSIIAEQI